jgi:hypothetical protein
MNWKSAPVPLPSTMPDGRFISAEAQHLELGMVVTTPDGLTAVVVGNEPELLAEPLLVYNLEVASAHTHFVEDGQGAQTPVWVHNKCNLNKNDAVSTFGVYEIFVNGSIHKIGKADLNRVTKASGLATRIHQQIRKREKVFGVGNVEVGRVYNLGITKTLKAQIAESTHILQSFKDTWFIPIGNLNSVAERLREESRL